MEAEIANDFSYWEEPVETSWRVGWIGSDGSQCEIRG